VWVHAQGTTLRGELEGVCTDGEITKVDERGRAGTRTSQRLDARDELACVIRLRHVVVGTKVKTCDLIVHLRLRAEDQVRRIRMAFIPGDLDYLRAGGRLSNAAYLGATLLRIKPTVDIIDGRLVATKKRHGSMLKCAASLTEEVLGGEPMDTSRVNFILTRSAMAPTPSCARSSRRSPPSMASMRSNGSRPAASSRRTPAPAPLASSPACARARDPHV